VLLTGRDEKYSFVIYQTGTVGEIWRRWKLWKQIYGYFLISVNSVLKKNICEFFDLNYHCPSVNLQGFAIGRDEKYL